MDEWMCLTCWGKPVRDALWLGLIAAVLLFGGVTWFAFRGGRHLGTPTQRATFQALHTANLAAPALRAGLTPDSASRAVPFLRRLLGADGLVLTDLTGMLAEDNVDATHYDLLGTAVDQVVASGRPQTVSIEQHLCDRAPVCTFQSGVVVPVQVDGAVVGTLVTFGSTASAGLLRLTAEVSQFVSTQLELAELDRSRARATRAELQFLRAQISPHFVYNALTAIESFVRSDPDRARELLIGFAEFTRYTFRHHGQFSTMAEELGLLDTYLELERARFGDRFDVTLRVAPEVLSVMVPSLILQPIVENAVRHGLEPNQTGQLEIRIEDAGSEALVTVDDDGVGADPKRIRRILSGVGADDAVGLRNVDERLRAVYGEDHGLLVETGLGAGTRVSLRIPKFHAAARAS
jgi:two-component system LytT family sensor kinase